MGYVGNQTTNAYTSMDKQDITGNGGASYTLSHAVANEQEIEVFVNNVRQEGGVGKAYTVSGTALTMTGNVSSSDEFYVVFQGKAVGTIVPPDGSVGTAKLANSAVTDAKINTMAASKLTGALPAIDGSALTNVVPSLVGFGVRGMTSVTTVSSYSSAFRFASAWATTDVNQGGLLHANGYGMVPSGQAGVYQISYFANHGSSTNYMQISLIRFIAASTSFQSLMSDLRANDYNYYTVGGTVLVDLAVGDQIFAGYNNNYAGVALNESGYNRFSMHKIG